MKRVFLHCLERLLLEGVIVEDPTETNIRDALLTHYAYGPGSQRYPDGSRKPGRPRKPKPPYKLKQAPTPAPREEETEAPEEESPKEDFYALLYGTPGESPLTQALNAAATFGESEEEEGAS